MKRFERFLVDVSVLCSNRSQEPLRRLDFIDTACRFHAGAMIEKKPTVASVTHTTIGFLAVLAVCTAFCGLLCIDNPKCSYCLLCAFWSVSMLISRRHGY